jgi:hypothetical protein
VAAQAQARVRRTRSAGSTHDRHDRHRQQPVTHTRTMDMCGHKLGHWHMHTYSRAPRGRAGSHVHARACRQTRPYTTRAGAHTWTRARPYTHISLTHARAHTHHVHAQAFTCTGARVHAQACTCAYTRARTHRQARGAWAASDVHGTLYKNEGAGRHPRSARRQRHTGTHTHANGHVSTRTNRRLPRLHHHTPHTPHLCASEEE